MFPAVPRLLCLLLLPVAVLTENMEWGTHADLVDEVDRIQGRENNKRVVLMQGENIMLECIVAFTSDPASKIVWRVHGEVRDATEEQEEESKGEDVDIKGHLRLSNISSSLGGKTVTCEYSKGRYGDSIEAFLRVFTLKIEASKEACDNCKGNVKLVFKESEGETPAEETVDKRIRAKIKDTTGHDDITVDKAGYSVTVAARDILTSPDISSMMPVIYKDMAQVSPDQCQCGPSEKTTTGDVSPLYALFAIPALILCIMVGLYAKKRYGK
jgi:hypothetical protein